ncbi:hypothetical protein VNO77_23836 [Canavalia gladiata]|uniref:Uncharacterized protein n=1 Tax=Canavalia gladiata TaxID=3824 RepID=A0AAN9LAE6_CANGL
MLNLKQLIVEFVEHGWLKSLVTLLFLSDRFLAVNYFNNMQAFFHLFEAFIYTRPIVSHIRSELLPNIFATQFSPLHLN